MKLITIIIPAWNEEKSLPFLFKRLDSLVKNSRGYEFEFLFINDGSKDKTLSILQQESKKNPRISYLNFSRNFGKEIAVAAGLDHADGDAVVIMDADGQEPPELIPEMIKWWEKGFDDVYARRNKTDRGLMKKSTSKLYYRTLQKMSRAQIQIDTGDFRLFSRRVVLALREFREASRQNKAIFSWVGFEKKEITFDQGDRVGGGDSKWNFNPLSPVNSLWDLAIDGFTSFSTIPLRFVSLFGVATSLVAFVYIIVIIIRAIFANVPAGYSSMMAVILFLGGVQMIALGVIGEYIGRIFIETKRRPLYLTEEFHRAKVATAHVSKGGKSEPSKKLDE